MAKKIMVIASGGGHWIQMRRLFPAFEGLDTFFVSVVPQSVIDIPADQYYHIRDCTRKSRWNIVVSALQIIRILFRERPDVIVTTGAAPGLLAIWMAKLLFRSRTIWIDSIANARVMSSSGRHARRVADVWLTQWPHIANKPGPEHWGSVF